MQREDHMTLPAVFFILALDIKSLGHVFGLPGTLTRRISIQRAATVSSRSHTCQVIITDTNCLRDYASKENLASKSVMRSQSLLVGSRVITLAPIRADRQRMEHSLADVWTRDLLPYPGMSPHRGEHLIRSSASMMMRKLSRAGKSNSLNKRSTSSTTVPDNRTNAISNDNGPAVELDQHELSTHYSQSYRRSLSRIEDESIRTLPSVDSPVQRSSAKGLNILRRRGTGSSHPISEQKDMVKRDESSYKSSAQGVSSKRSNPKMLLKTLSSDAIRSWFT